MTTDPPKASKSGRWQFSLRGLLVLVVVLGLGLVWLGNRLQRQWFTAEAARHKILEERAATEAIDKIQTIGGKVERSSRGEKYE